MGENLQNRLKRFEELERLLSDPAVLNDPKQVRVFAKEHAGLKPVVDEPVILKSFYNAYGTFAVVNAIFIKK